MDDQPALDRQASPVKEPTEPIYLEGYDDASAQVVLQGSDGVALRVHDYYLKASSVFFRELLEAGTKGGPIPLEATSQQLKFIMDIVMGRTPTKKTLRLISKQAPKEVIDGEYDLLWSLIDLDRVARKYLLDIASIHIRDTIAEDHVHDHAPLSLSYACEQTIANNALRAFRDNMPIWMDDYFHVHNLVFLKGDVDRDHGYLSPAIHNITSTFAKSLGTEGLLAYAKALHGASYGIPDSKNEEENDSDFGMQWDSLGNLTGVDIERVEGERWLWESVTQAFVGEMGIKSQRVYMEDSDNDIDEHEEVYSGSPEV